MAKKIKLDFSKTEDRAGWNTRHMPEGLHLFKVIGVEDSEAQDGTDMFVFALKPVEKKYATRLFPFYCKLQANQYWKLRDLLVAAGQEVPKKAITVDPNKAVGKLIACEVIDASGQYEGRSEIQGTFDPSVIDGEAADDEDEYEGDEDADEGEDEEESDEPALEDMTLVELRKLAKEYDIATTGLKKDELIEAIEEAEEEADDELDDDELDDEELDDEEFEDDEEEEDEEPEPAPRRRTAAPAKKPAAKPAAKAPAKAAAKPAARRIVRR